MWPYVQEKANYTLRYQRRKGGKIKKKIAWFWIHK